MSYTLCPKCLSLIDEGEAMCRLCTLDAMSPASSEPVSTPRRSQRLSDAITAKVGLEPIERFSLRAFFGGVFGRRGADRIEEHLSVGFRTTTPPLSPAMAAMPSPWLFGRCLVLTLLIFMPLWWAFRSSGNILLVPGLILIGAFAVPVTVLVLFFELNTPRNVSVTRVAHLFLTGAATALLFSTLLYDNITLLGWFGAPAAGLVEEAAKLLALAFITRNFARDRYRYALNGLLFGAAVGAGFAAFETAGYALAFGQMGGAAAMLRVLELRGLLSPFGHIVWSAMIGCAYWRQRGEGRNILASLTDAAFLRVFVAAMGLHAAWNMSLSLPFGAEYLALGFTAWVIVLSLTQSGLKQVGRLAASN